MLLSVRLEGGESSRSLSRPKLKRSSTYMYCPHQHCRTSGPESLYTLSNSASIKCIMGTANLSPFVSACFSLTQRGQEERFWIWHLWDGVKPDRYLNKCMPPPISLSHAIPVFSLTPTGIVSSLSANIALQGFIPVLLNFSIKYPSVWYDLRMTDFDFHQ